MEERLKELMQALTADGTLGYIVRTNAEGQTREALAEDVLATLRRPRGRGPGHAAESARPDYFWPVIRS